MGRKDTAARRAVFVTVRTAQPEDVPALARLFDGQNEFHAALVPHRIRRVDPADTEAWCYDLVCHGRHELLVAAENGGALVGLAQLAARIEPESAVEVGRRRAEIVELYVAPEARRQGVGRQLVAAARAWADAKGLDELALGVWTNNDEAIAFYRALGFATERLTMRMPRPAKGKRGK